MNLGRQCGFYFNFNFFMKYNPENHQNAPRETEEGTELRTLPSKQEPQQVQTTKLRNKLEGKEPEPKPIQTKGSAQEM